MPTDQPFDYVPVVVPNTTGLTADQILILGDITSLEARVIQRRLWSASSVRELLQAAVNASIGGGDPVKGRDAFHKAEVVFQNDVQTKNRLFYLLGVLIGLAGVTLIAWTVLALAKWRGLSELAAPEIVVALFAFAGMGSVASVLARLATIDLKDELRRKWVVVSAATRPILAIAFASVVYVIISGGVIKIAGFEAPESRKPLIWIAAFLCGYSERFATDLLDRLPFTKPPESSPKP